MAITGYCASGQYSQSHLAAIPYNKDDETKKSCSRMLGQLGQFTTIMDFLSA
jgi:hypothetical protein